MRDGVPATPEDIITSTKNLILVAGPSGSASRLADVMTASGWVITTADPSDLLDVVERLELQLIIIDEGQRSQLSPDIFVGLRERGISCPVLWCSGSVDGRSAVADLGAPLLPRAFDVEGMKARAIAAALQVG